MYIDHLSQPSSKNKVPAELTQSSTKGVKRIGQNQDDIFGEFTSTFGICDTCTYYIHVEYRAEYTGPARGNILFSLLLFL